MKVWLDGKLVDKNDAKVSVYDHGLLYGDGVFEGIRSYKGRAFELDAHVARLFESAHSIRMAIPWSKADVKRAVNDTLKVNKIADGYIRVVVTRGLDPAKCDRPTMFVITDQISLYPPEWYREGMPVITAATIRNHPNAMPPRIKSLNYLNNILAKIEARDAGVFEAIMLNHEGLVAECTGDNIFIAKDGELLTPPISAGILIGITQRFVMKLAKKMGITVREINLTRHDLYVADECFLTGTAAEVIPVRSVDQRTVGTGKPGPITKKLMAAFHKAIGRK
ncbi:MAG: branched-chain-amino-acid transaminase [Phycisphaerae bacterium]|nr:branched-chain-amino-acid transaminase [Phycisphaerae bacterium]